MGHRAFEFAVRDLMRRDGCRVERVGGGGDRSADVLATDPAGRRRVLRCEHERDPLHGSAVGVGVLYAPVGTDERVHRARVPVLVTNGTFTAPARTWGSEQDVALVDREVLGRWASTGRPLWELLPRIPAPRSGHEGRTPGRSPPGPPPPAAHDLIPIMSIRLAGAPRRPAADHPSGRADGTDRAR